VRELEGKSEEDGRGTGRVLMDDVKSSATLPLISQITQVILDGKIIEI
jgi:hypothetical protein